MTSSNPVMVMVETKVEDLEEHGRRLTTPDMNSLIPQVISENNISHPEPKAASHILTKDTRILELSSYYNSEDHEQVAVVKFQSKSHPEGSWSDARRIISTSTSSYSHLRRFHRHQERSGLE